MTKQPNPPPPKTAISGTIQIDIGSIKVNGITVAENVCIEKTFGEQQKRPVSPPPPPPRRTR